MFFILGKQKIYSYVIAASTVVVLFVLSFFFIKTDTQDIQASSNFVQNNVEDKIFNALVNN